MYEVVKKEIEILYRTEIETDIKEGSNEIECALKQP